MVLGVLALILVNAGCSYNNFVRKGNTVDNAMGNIQSAYQRRADLIPNLVEVVKGYAKHEKEVLEQIAESRAKVGSVQLTKEVLENPDLFKKYQENQNQISSTLKSILSIAENYPDLKANQNFLELQTELSRTENRIKIERDNFNGTVKDYNNAVQTFPSNIWAGIFGKKERQYFQSEPGSEKVPEVKF